MRGIQRVGPLWNDCVEFNEKLIGWLQLMEIQTMWHSHYHNPTMMDQNETIKQLEERLSRLENSARGWRKAFLGMAALLGFVTLVAAGPSGIAELIQARNIEVVDAAGNPLISLTSNEMGGMMLVFNNQKSPVVVAGASPQGGTLGISNIEGNPVGLMESTELGGSVSTKSYTGQTLAAFGVTPDGGAVLVNNNMGRNRVILKTKEEGGQVDILSRNGKPVFSMLPYGVGGGLVMLDTVGTARMTIVCDETSGVISLFNPTGNMTWQAPNAGFFGGQ